MAPYWEVFRLKHPRFFAFPRNSVTVCADPASAFHRGISTTLEKATLSRQQDCLGFAPNSLFQ